MIPHLSALPGYETQLALAYVATATALMTPRHRPSRRTPPKNLSNALVARPFSCLVTWNALACTAPFELSMRVWTTRILTNCAQLCELLCYNVSIYGQAGAAR